MKHSSSRELFAYWDRQRGNRAAPERVDIEPAAIRRVLGDTFILGADVGIEHRFRLAGTRVCALFGRELKNEPFVTLFEQPHQSSVRELVAIVAEETVGVIAGIHGRTTEGFATELELLLLPLCHRGNINRRMVGILAPSEVPFWLGSSQLGPIALGSLRHIGPSIETVAAPRFAATARPEQLRQGFVVYDGGRS